MAKRKKKPLGKNCLFCSKELYGRNDKKFCNDQCRTDHHNKTISVERGASLIKLKIEMKAMKAMCQDLAKRINTLETKTQNQNV